MIKLLSDPVTSNFLSIRIICNYWQKNESIILWNPSAKMYIVTQQTMERSESGLHVISMANLMVDVNSFQTVLTCSATYDDI